MAIIVKGVIERHWTHGSSYGKWSGEYYFNLSLGDHWDAPFCQN